MNQVCHSYRLAADITMPHYTLPWASYLESKWSEAHSFTLQSTMMTSGDRKLQHNLVLCLVQRWTTNVSLSVLRHSVSVIEGSNLVHHEDYSLSIYKIS